MKDKIKEIAEKQDHLNHAEGKGVVDCCLAAIREALASQWISVELKNPPTGKVIFAQFGKNISRCMYIAKHSWSDDDGEFHGDMDYSEEDDKMYWPEGWYEWNVHEEIHWMIGEDPTHWMPIPEPPKQ